MKAFIVLVNGKRICMAGIGTDGVISTIVNWSGGGTRRAADGHFHFHVGGLDSRTGEHLSWETPELKVGDVVTVEIVETERVDPESKRFRRDPSNFEGPTA